MSKASDDATVTADTVIENNTEQRDPSSSYHMISNSSIRSSSSSSTSANVEIMNKENDLNSQRIEEKAMGDICSSDDPMKSITESSIIISHIINDNDNNQTQSKSVKMKTKSMETKKTQTRTSDDARHRVNGAIYVGHNRRASINNGSRSTIYTSRDYWRPHSTTACNDSNIRRSTPSALNARTRQISDISRAARPETTTENSGNANQHGATTNESQKKQFTCTCIQVTSQVTRTFHNGTLRANRILRGNVTTRSRSHTIASDFNSQFSSSEYVTNSESIPYVNGIGVSRTSGIYHSIRNTNFNQKRGKFPIIYVAPTGTISILLDKGVMIEVAVDRAVRVLCHDKFSAVCNSRGTGSCILHKKARIFQQDEKVFCNFGPTLTVNEKATVFGTQGVLFTMSHLSEAYLVSSTIVKGTLSVALGRLQFPSLDYDFTVRMFFTESQTGDQFTELCNKIVQEARYGTRDDGSLTLTINGVYIKQDKRGDVEVNCRPKHITCSLSDCVVHVRTNMVDMAVQEDDKAFVKRGLKRVHVSRSGMVVSDGNCITSMDHFGHIVSST
ncbi:hypothetical protein DINM_006202 [Dirofilaria immitis]|nr:hypothetical protein [Dirofilaria immitis]